MVVLVPVLVKGMGGTLVIMGGVAQGRRWSHTKTPRQIPRFRVFFPTKTAVHSLIFPNSSSVFRCRSHLLHLCIMGNAPMQCPVLVDFLIPTQSKELTVALEQSPQHARNRSV